MKPAPFNLLLETASRDNILVLTTRCSTACVFCSHLQNPREVDAYYVEELTREQIETQIEFLDEGRKIIIGESATRICEGEPFLREDIIEILQSIRRRYPRTAVQITTSGINLNGDILAGLERIGNIELNISLNSSSQQGRKALYRGKAHMEAVAAVKQLGAYGIGYSGSIVAMPQLAGWEDIKASVLFLCENGASTVRLFTPGYTRFTKGVLPPPDIRSSLEDFAADVRSFVDVPLIVEPPVVKDLIAEVLGVMRDSPARRAGISPGDRILRIDGREAVSRVDAYYKLFKARNPTLEIHRKDNSREIIVEKPAKSPSGLVFNYDIHPDTINAVERGILRNRGKSRLILTSELAYDILAACVGREEGVEIEAARNRFFGGNIMCAGLLTLSDIELHVAERSRKPEVLFLPGIMFDSSGRDLLGKQYKETEGNLGIKVEVI